MQTLARARCTLPGAHYERHRPLRAVEHLSERSVRSRPRGVHTGVSGRSDTASSSQHPNVRPRRRESAPRRLVNVRPAELYSDGERHLRRRYFCRTVSALDLLSDP